MSFMLSCPNCGKRHVSEYSFGGEYSSRPKADEPFSEWVDYVYFKDNTMGKQIEWWYHSSGCRRWFLVERDTLNNTDHKSFWYEERANFMPSTEPKKESEIMNKDHHASA